MKIKEQFFVFLQEINIFKHKLNGQIKTLKLMKTNGLIFLLLGAIALSMSSCGSKKDLAKAEDSREIGSIPCSGSDYATDEEYFRANESGESPRMSMAKRQAILNAKATLAGNIESQIKTVSQQYTNQRSFESEQSKVEFEEQFEEMTRNVVDQQLNDVKIICEKALQGKDNGDYQYFVAVEMPKEALMDNIDNEISKKERLQLEYDKQKFQEIYDEEMKNIEEERDENM
ncbi:MAG: hypothetical protein ACQEQ0_03600 [Bacteroidota bacterium]